jgi:hypothetical protein
VSAIWNTHKKTFIGKAPLLSKVRARDFDVEPLCVLDIQSMPAELHGLGTDDASNGSSARSRSRTSKQVCQPGAPRDEVAIDIVPERQARAAAERLGLHRRSLHPSCTRAAWRLSPLHAGLGDQRRRHPERRKLYRLHGSQVPIGVERCPFRTNAPGRFSACQTFSSEWRGSLTTMSFHFSPSFRACAPLAGPGLYWPRSVTFFSFFFFYGGAPLRMGEEK